MTQDLIPRDQSIALSPQDVINNATVQAKLLMDIVNKTGCFQLISGKKYLQVEAWETIGAFNSVHAGTEAITPITKDGATVGYDAKVNLVNRDGFVVGSAIMPCYFTENACKGKSGDAKDKAAKSAAQTFATSKAYRMNYSYVAILAGYEACPAEEMTAEPIDKAQHYCQEHDTLFFKSKNMRSYAHPIGDTGGWCHEHEAKPVVSSVLEAGEENLGWPTPAQATTSSSEKPIEAIVKEDGGDSLGVAVKERLAEDLEFWRNTVNEIAKKKKWNRVTVNSIVKNNFIAQDFEALGPEELEKLAGIMEGM